MVLGILDKTFAHELHVLFFVSAQAVADTTTEVEATEAAEVVAEATMAAAVVEAVRTYPDCMQARSRVFFLCRLCFFLLAGEIGLFGNRVFE